MDLHAGGRRAAGAHNPPTHRAEVRSALIDDRADLDSSALLQAGTTFRHRDSRVEIVGVDHEIAAKDSVGPVVAEWATLANPAAEVGDVCANLSEPVGFKNHV